MMIIKLTDGVTHTPAGQHVPLKITDFKIKMIFFVLYILII